ncbi:hypothetical protein CLOSTASPAR_00066 [[Clostridium] asparagiforme DSM 15981]|uniref:Uncharacterized protein n=1 Tax=[Clostridium] asparagiforme DSM 15981 TaxID=518636 RepID=C0CSX2_9FIRM|nr:hypothetical protein CLOSTASPAR_00066 [[Clostridium] asparagiforme DSM 15981]
MHEPQIHGRPRWEQSAAGVGSGRCQNRGRPAGAKRGGFL